MIDPNNVPDVRIGVLQSADQVEFTCNDSFTIQNKKGETLFTGGTDQKYKLTISSSEPAEISYQVRAGIETDREKA